jgi:hypothetical protein
VEACRVPTEPQPQDLRPYVRAFIGSTLAVGGIAAIGVAIVHLLHIGSCASGNTPFVIARPCPSGTASYALLIPGGLLVACIGIAIAGMGMLIWGGMGFMALGIAAIYGAATAPAGSGSGGSLGGYIVGGVFIPMGLAALAFVLSMRRDGHRQTAKSPPARLSGLGLRTMIATTSPKPLPGHETDLQPKGSRWDS